MRLEASFDAAEVSGGVDISVVETGGNTFNPAALATGLYFLSIGASTAAGDHASEVTSISSLLAWLETTLNAGGDPGGTYTVSLTAAGRVRILHDGGGGVTAVAITMNAAANAIFGFTVDPSGGLDYTGDVDPYYVINGAIGFWTDMKPERHAGNFAHDVIGHDGAPGGITRPGRERHFDITMPLEPREKLYPYTIGDASPAASWSWDDFFVHCSNRRPFALVDGLDSLITFLRLRGEGAGLDPQSVGDANFIAYYDVPIRARVLARMSEP